MDERTMYIKSQVAAEVIGIRLLNIVSKHGKHVASPNIDDAVRRYSKLFDKIDISLDKLNNEYDES